MGADGAAARIGIPTRLESTRDRRTPAARAPAATGVNTLVHVVEAYAALERAAPDPQVRSRLTDLVGHLVADGPDPPLTMVSGPSPGAASVFAPLAPASTGSGFGPATPPTTSDRC